MARQRWRRARLKAIAGILDLAAGHTVTSRESMHFLFGGVRPLASTALTAAIKRATTGISLEELFTFNLCLRHEQFVRPERWIAFGLFRKAKLLHWSKHAVSSEKYTFVKQAILAFAVATSHARQVVQFTCSRWNRSSNSLWPVATPQRLYLKLKAVPAFCSSQAPILRLSPAIQVAGQLSRRAAVTAPFG